MNKIGDGRGFSLVHLTWNDDPYTTLKFLALQGAPHIYNISRLRVKATVTPQDNNEAIETNSIDSGIYHATVCCAVGMLMCQPLIFSKRNPENAGSCS
jgi:hypothetical protein